MKINILKLKNKKKQKKQNANTAFYKEIIPLPQ